MGIRRVVLLVTCVAVTALAVVLMVLSWDQANKVAAVVSALAGVAAVGVGVWAALTNPGSGDDIRIRVVSSGRAVSGKAGRALSGVRAPVDRIRGDVAVERSAEADASAGGEAVSGIDLTD